MKVWITATIISLTLLVIGSTGIYWAISSNSRVAPTLGDWGDAMGALIASIAFVWLIALHMDNSQQIQENQIEILRTNEKVEELLSVMSDISASLARSAGAEAAQAGVEFQRMAPEIVFIGSMAGASGRSTQSTKPQEVRCDFRNDGYRVRIEEVSRVTGHIEVHPLRPLPFEWLSTHPFSVHVVAQRPLREIGEFSFKVRYSQAHGPIGTKIVRFPRFEDQPSILEADAQNQSS